MLYEQTTPTPMTPGRRDYLEQRVRDINVKVVDVQARYQANTQAFEEKMQSPRAEDRPGLFEQRQLDTDVQTLANFESEISRIQQNIARGYEE